LSLRDIHSLLKETIQPSEIFLRSLAHMRNGVKPA
jgi:hypothetical protein